MHILSNFTSIYLHRKLSFCSMAKGNGRPSVPSLKGKKKREKNRDVLYIQLGEVSEYASTYLHIALRPFNVTQKTMDSTVLLISGRVF